MYLKLDKKYLGAAETSLKARYMKVYEVHRPFTVFLGLKNQVIRFIIKRRIVVKIKVSAKYKLLLRNAKRNDSMD